MYVELNPESQVRILDSDDSSRLELLTILRELGMSKASQEIEVRKAIEDYVTNPPDLLIICCYSDVNQGVQVLRDLKSFRDMPNFPIVPVVRVAERVAFMQVAVKYGVMECMLYPFTKQNVIAAITQVVYRFDTSFEEKGISAAKLALADGSMETAIAEFEFVRSKNCSIRTEIGLSQAFLGKDNPEKAQEFLDSASQFDSENFEVVLSSFEFLIRSEQDATIVVSKVGQIRHILTPTYRITQLLKSFLRMQKTAHGLAVLQKYGKEWAELEPASVRLIWAKLYYSNENPKEATSLLIKLIKSKYANAEAYNLLGVIASQSGNIDMARGYYEEAMRINPSDYRLIFNLSLIHLKQKNWFEAKRLLRACLSLAPNFEKARQHLQKILDAESEDKNEIQ